MRGVRLELEVTQAGLRGRRVLARLSRPGELRFEWSPEPRGHVYLLLATASRPSPGEIAGRLGGPLIAGNAWSRVDEALVKLVVDMPAARDRVEKVRLAAE